MTHEAKGNTLADCLDQSSGTGTVERTGTVKELSLELIIPQLKTNCDKYLCPLINCADWYAEDIDQLTCHLKTHIDNGIDVVKYGKEESALTASDLIELGWSMLRSNNMVYHSSPYPLRSTVDSTDYVKTKLPKRLLDYITLRHGLTPRPKSNKYKSKLKPKNVNNLLYRLKTEQRIQQQERKINCLINRIDYLEEEVSRINADTDQRFETLEEDVSTIDNIITRVAYS